MDGPTLAEAHARMVRLGAELPRGDGVRWFNELYREVTEEVVRRLAAGAFEDPRWFEALAARFAAAYLRAVDDAAAVPPPADASRAWAPLFAARHDRRVAPIQFALAGMNAHINFDLAVVVRDTCRALGTAPVEGSPQHRDYVLLNAVLADVQGRVKPRLTPGWLGVLDRALGRLDDVVASFSVARARDGAWVHAQALWEVRDDPRRTASYVAALDRLVGLAGRGVVRPTLLGLARWAEAQGWLPGPARVALGAPGGR